MKPNVLCVGMVCVDVVNLVERFPVEDSDMRTIDQWRSRGGNASNNCTALSELGVDCEFFGSLSSDDDNTKFIQNDMQKSGIRWDRCPLKSGFPTPNSCIIVNKTSGSRTILHTNLGLPELELEEFSSLDLSGFDWIHFEGRNVDVVAGMAEHVAQLRLAGRIHQSVKISLEVEKIFRNYGQILPHVDFVFVSKEFAKSKGFETKSAAIRNLEKILGPNLKPSTVVVCGWGEDGVAARNLDGNIYEVAAVAPASGHVLDTIGAGDTLIAATVAAILIKKTNLVDALQAAVRVAGNKVGQIGFVGLGKFL